MRTHTHTHTHAHTHTRTRTHTHIYTHIIENHHHTHHQNYVQEFLAYGLMNLAGAFFGSFPTAGALSRTVLQDATGGNTQLVGFISSGIVILVILFLGSLFGSLPNVSDTNSQLSS